MSTRACGVAVRDRRAFTMLEMMLVLVVMGILMTAVIWNFGGFTNEARTRLTHARLRQVGAAIESYEAAPGSTPSALGTLLVGSSSNRLVRGTLKDGWKQPFVYAADGIEERPFDLSSKGADRAEGTADDIDYWTIVEQD